MEDLKNALNENAAFYRDQERRIIARLALLPKGRIRSRKIAGDVYHYLQYRKGRSVKTDYIGKGVPRELSNHLAERDRLERELLRVREALRLLRSARGGELDLSEPLLAIFQAMTKQKMWEAGVEIIGRQEDLGQSPQPIGVPPAQAVHRIAPGAPGKEKKGYPASRLYRQIHIIGEARIGSIADSLGRPAEKVESPYSESVGYGQGERAA